MINILLHIYNTGQIKVSSSNCIPLFSQVQRFHYASFLCVLFTSSQSAFRFHWEIVRDKCDIECASSKWWHHITVCHRLIGKKIDKIRREKMSQSVYENQIATYLPNYNQRIKIPQKYWNRFSGFSWCTCRKNLLKTMASECILKLG